MHASLALDLHSPARRACNLDFDSASWEVNQEAGVKDRKNESRREG